MPRVLFVCSSDRTRAPLAAALFHAAAKAAGLEEELTCDSAGIRAQHGQHIADGVIEVLAEKGIEPRRIGVQMLSPKLIKAAELVLVMTSDQEKEITTNYISARNKTKTLMSVMRSDADIFDPNHCSVERFRACRDMMEPAIIELVERLK